MMIFSRLQSFWKWEAGAVLSSLIFLLIIVILLLIYDDKPIWDRHGVTLNAVISVLATASKASMMFAIGESIGQWKWLLFAREPRAVMDLEYIDAASRGPLGSAKALWPARKLSLIRLGAVITILTLALDPFAQQLVQYNQRNRDVGDQRTTIARAQRYSRGSVTPEYPFGAVAETDFSMESAILYGLVQQYDTISQQLPFSCATGNCTWEPFESLAVCSVCNDLTSQLTSYSAANWLWINLAGDQAPVYSKNLNGTTFELPNGLLMNNEDGVPYLNDSSLDGTVYMTSYGSGNASKTVSMKDNDSLIWAISVIKMSNDTQQPWPLAPVEAFECGIYYCVNRYEAKVQNGTLHEIETPADASRSPQSWQPFVYDGGYYQAGFTPNQTSIANIAFENVSWTPRTDLMFGDQYNLSQGAVESISSYFQQNFKVGDLAANLTERQNQESDLDLVTVNGYLIDLGYYPRVMQVVYQTSSLNDTFRSLAKSMSNSIRGDADGATVQTGTTQVMTTYYHVVWPWITLHATLTLAAIVFLLITMRQTSRMGIPAWKSHSLAPLSRHSEIGDFLVGMESLTGMEQKASQRFVQFFGETNYQRISNDTPDMAAAGLSNPHNKTTRAGE